MPNQPRPENRHRMVRVEDDLWQEAAEACATLGTTRAEVMREALRQVVKKAHAQTPPRPAEAKRGAVEHVGPADGGVVLGVTCRADSEDARPRSWRTLYVMQYVELAGREVIEGRRFEDCVFVGASRGAFFTDCWFERCDLTALNGATIVNSVLRECALPTQVSGR